MAKQAKRCPASLLVGGMQMKSNSEISLCTSHPVKTNKTNGEAAGGIQGKEGSPITGATGSAQPLGTSNGNRYGN